MATQFYQRLHNRRQDQADRNAKALYKKARSFNRRIEFNAPGDVNVRPDMTATLSGTGTAWDRTYQIKTVTFLFDQPEGASESGGFTMTIEAAEDVPDAGIANIDNTFGANSGVLESGSSILAPEITPGAPNDGFAGQ